MKYPIITFLSICLILVIFSLDAFAVEYTTSYIYFDDKIILNDKDNDIEYYHNDYLGNVVVKTDEDGDITWKADYEPFGDTFNEQGNSEFRFTGKELDNTGLHYFGARYYDKETGRFISADSVEGNIQKPQTLNRYSYVLNNPLRYNDPDGNQYSETQAKRLEEAAPGLQRDYANSGSEIIRRNVLMIFQRGVYSSQVSANVETSLEMNMFEDNNVELPGPSASLTVSDQGWVNLQEKKDMQPGMSSTENDNTNVVAFTVATPKVEVKVGIFGWLAAKVKVAFGFTDYYTREKTNAQKAVSSSGHDKDGDGQLSLEEIEQETQTTVSTWGSGQ